MVGAHGHSSCLVHVAAAMIILVFLRAKNVVASGGTGTGKGWPYKMVTHTTMGSDGFRTGIGLGYYSQCSSTTQPIPMPPNVARAADAYTRGATYYLAGQRAQAS